LGNRYCISDRFAAFWPGRITKVASEMGKGIKAFKDGLTGEDTEEKAKPEDKK